MRDNISPEEKLLRLIRKEKKQDVILGKKSLTTPLDFKPTIKPSIHPLIQKYPHLFDIRKTIGVVFVTSCIYLISSLIYPWVGLKKIKLPKITPGKIIESQPEAKVEVKPYEFYQQGIANKQIFSGSATQETGKPASGINIDLMKDINLVGIVSGENPQAVIEDKKTNKTYYVSKGQFIGEMQVEDIQEGKIIVGYRGQRFELYL